MHSLWDSPERVAWQRALDRYGEVVARQGVAPLVGLDEWYREVLPVAISGRPEAHVTHAELARVTEWKMARGVWRARNLALVRGNPPQRVEAASRDALAAIPDPRRPIALLAKLKGVGPATASAVLAAVAPEQYPFFDELVAAQVPALGPVAFTAAYYARYADALSGRAGRLAGGWTATMVERALWAHAGGKAGVRGPA